MLIPCSRWQGDLFSWARMRPFRQILLSCVCLKGALAYIPPVGPSPSRISPVRSSFYDSYDSNAMRVQERDRPDWAGGGAASNIVNALINNQVLYGLMKVGARQVLINQAEEKGIEWRRVAEELMESKELKAIYDQQFAASDKAMTYPEYYTMPFHAYEDGNLNWLAAAEVESATSSMCLRVWPKDKDIRPAAAQDRLRASYLNVLKAYLSDVSATDPQRVIDVGCSAGVSTRYLRSAFPKARAVTGIDLSPHFLSVAALREKQSPQGIAYLHAQAEATTLLPASQDLAMLTFIAHELPTAATKDILAEMYRVLGPGGVVAITDNDPRSPIIQRLPKPLAILMKSTEPFADEYYSLNMEKALEEAGFKSVRTVGSDPRHRTIMAQKPRQ